MQKRGFLGLFRPEESFLGPASVTSPFSVSYTHLDVYKRQPIFLGGGATGDNIHELMQYFDGVSVATWIKNGDMKNPIDPERAKVFISEAKRKS